MRLILESEKSRTHLGGVWTALDHILNYEAVCFEQLVIAGG